MIGIRSLAIVVLLGAAIAIGVASGRLGLAALGHLSVASCLALGALAAIGVGLLRGMLSQPGSAALELRRGRLVVEPSMAPAGAPGAGGRILELPGWVLRACLGLSFLVIGAASIGNHGVVRLRELGAGGPPAGRCKDPALVEEAPAVAPAPPPPPVDQAGCALVRRAYQLGYAKTLGSCAPRQAPTVAAAPKVALAPEPCVRRHVDEPYLHYAWRRWAEATRWVAAVRPVAGTSARVDEVRARLGAFGTLTASSGHALGATPHAAHHLWISLPDPEPAGWLARWLAADDCGARYVDLPLWPRLRPGQESALVQHALGQLLFAARFGTVTACANYRFHWGAPLDACERLIADPRGFLREQGAWEELVGVLDRRRRQLEVRALARTLGQLEPPTPAPASAAVSLQCLSVDARAARATVSGRTVTIEGELIGVRQLRVPRVSPELDGPIELLLQLAQLLAGAAPTSAADDRAIAELIDDAAGEATDEVVAPSPDDAAGGGGRAPRAAGSSPEQLLDGPGFPLARLEAIEGGDPFAGVRWPLRRPDLIDLYPFQQTLFAFIDGFRRRYHAQRGRI